MVTKFIEHEKLQQSTGIDHADEKVSWIYLLTFRLSSINIWYWNRRIDYPNTKATHAIDRMYA